MLTVLPEDKKSSHLPDTAAAAVEDAYALRSSEVPFRIPKFERPKALNSHIFEANG